MESEDLIFKMNETSIEALKRNDIDELYIIRTQMNSILEEEERKPLDFHSDKYYVCAYLVCLDLYDLPRALRYAEKVKQPTDRVIRRIALIRNDLNNLQRVSYAASYNLDIARNGSMKRIQIIRDVLNRQIETISPASYGITLYLILLLKTYAIIQYRLGQYQAAITSLERAREYNPADAELLYYLIMSLRRVGNDIKADYLVEYSKRLNLKENLQKLFANL